MHGIPILDMRDGYKVGHVFQYPPGTTMVYSNLTPRTSRIEGLDGVVAFGFQYFVEEYLRRQFDMSFFSVDRKEVVDQYSRRITNYLGPGISTEHVEELHDLGYLPLLIKAVPEGTIIPHGVPMLTIRNTDPRFFWLTNMLETIMANVLWMPCTSATTALRYRRVFDDLAEETGGDREFVPWQGHDFSFRGLAGLEAACLSGAGHLLSFVGTDTIPAIDFLEEYYGADSDEELIGGSVPATEHSVMSMGMEDGEQETFERLIGQVHPEGIISIVSDTWDLWKVLTEYLPALKGMIMARNGKVVIRPDSGDPVTILLGDPFAPKDSPQFKGVVRLLWETFGGRTNTEGFKELDPHVGVIYGDSITPERQVTILEGLKFLGFASTNIVLGIGSYTYQYTTRDVHGFAMKATYGETLKGGPQVIFKDPVTDDGGKTSARGLLSVRARESDGHLELHEECSWEEEGQGLLQPIFSDGEAVNLQTLAEIRGVLRMQA